MHILQGIGPILKKVRTERNISLAEIADVTKIRTKYLQAIEDENFDLLPGDIYAKGFVHTYARYLKIEDWPEITEILHPVNQTPVETIPIPETSTREAKHIKMPPKRLEEKSITKKTPVIIGLSVLALAALLGVQYLYSHAKAPEDTPQTPPAVVDGQHPTTSSNQTTPSDNSGVVPPATTPEQTYSNGLTMEIEIVDLKPNSVDKCWTRATADGQVAFEETLNEGAKKTITAQNKISLRVGNAGIVKVKLNGQDLGFAGTGTQVVTKDYTLDSLKTLPDDTKNTVTP